MFGISTISFDMMVFICIAIIGIILSIFVKPKLTNDGSSGPATSSIWGYGLIIFAIFGMIFTSFSFTTSMTNITKYNTFEYVKKLFVNSLLPIIVLLLSLWVFSLYTIYFKKINEGKISPNVNLYNIIISSIFVIQFITIFQYMFSQLKNIDVNKKITDILKHRNALIIYVTSLLNIIFIGLMTISLKFFSTDG